MDSLKQMFAALFDWLKTPFTGGPAIDSEEAAWVAYQSTWEMDLPPEPRAVFLAGVRTGRELRDD